MDWFNPSGISNLAKSAVSKAQRSIDKVLDIKDEVSQKTCKTIDPTVSREEFTNRCNTNFSIINEGKHHQNKDTLPKVEMLMEDDFGGDSFFNTFLECSNSISNSKAQLAVSQIDKLPSSDNLFINPDDLMQVKPINENLEHQIHEANIGIPRKINKSSRTSECETRTCADEICNLEAKQGLLILCSPDKEVRGESLDKDTVISVNEELKKHSENAFNMSKSNKSHERTEAMFLHDCHLLTKKCKDMSLGSQVNSSSPLCCSTDVGEIVCCNQLVEATTDETRIFSMPLCNEPVNLSPKREDCGDIDNPQLLALNECESSLGHEGSKQFYLHPSDLSTDVLKLDLQLQLESTENVVLEGSLMKQCKPPPTTSVASKTEQILIGKIGSTNTGAYYTSDSTNKGYGSVSAPECESANIKVFSNVAAIAETQLDQPGSAMQNATQIVTNEQELSRLKELLNAREMKLIHLSKENIDLEETVSAFRNQLNQLRREMVPKDIIAVNEDEERISKHIANVEELVNVVKERDSLKQKLRETEDRLTKSSDDLVAHYTAALTEKERVIAELLTEGESLSKREFKSSNALKKLKVKFRDVELKYEQSRKQNEAKNSELSKLQDTINMKFELEKTMQDQLQTFEIIADKQANEISRLKDCLDDSEDKINGLQTTLDCGYQEINRLNLEKSNMESEIKDITLVKQAREESDRKVFDTQRIAKNAREQLLSQIEDLRLTIKNMEKAATQREESLKVEIVDLQQKFEDAVCRNQELSQSIGDVSRPLLRQLENLQNINHNQARNWEKVEKQLSEQLASCQHQLTLSVDKERSAVDYALEMKVRVASLESQATNMLMDKEELNKQLMEKNELVKHLEDDLKMMETKFKSTQKNHIHALEGLRTEKVAIKDQLVAERLRYESDTTTAVERDDVVCMRGYMNPHSRTSSSDSSTHVVDTPNTLSTAAVMEQLQMKLRQKDGELQVQAEELVLLQMTRESLSKELVILSNRIENMQDKCAKHEDLMKFNQELESRYNAVLQMYGEKAEEVDELKMDLYDVKQMYKQQLQQFFEK